jgi:sigma-54-dependent transcriptional regulator
VERAVDALADLASEGEPGAVADERWAELMRVLGVSGVEVRRRCDGGVLWSFGCGREEEADRRGAVEIIPKGGRPEAGPIWRALAALLVMTLGGGEPPSDLDQDIGIDGSSCATCRLREDVRRAAPTDLTVLLLGETGTGKEVVAHATHRLSGRTGSFVPVNVAAIPTDLLEAELFGSVRGAFTGADRARDGLVQAADGGTLFLDEIGDLDVAMQAKLLRVLESGEVRPVGSTRFRSVNARIVAATHRDLESLVVRGAFRADLYYRLAQAVIRIPPLRERAGDLIQLRSLFEAEASRRLGIPRCRWSEAAEIALANHHWPGNIRELRYVVERAMVDCRGGIVSRRVLGLPDQQRAPARRWDEATASFRRRFLTAALHRNGGNRSATARELGISRQTLLYHIRSLGIGPAAGGP